MATLAREIADDQNIELELPDIFGSTDKDHEEDEEDEEDEYIEEDIMPPKSTTPRKAASSLTTTSVSDKVSAGDQTSQHLPYPMVWGNYQSFNLTSRKRYTHLVFRLLVHSFMTEHDIEFVWIHPRKLKIRVAWPDWWVCPEQQANFDVDQYGNPAFAVDHQLIGDIMDNNEARKSKDGRVWDDGYFLFDRDMSLIVEETQIMLKKIEITSTKQIGQFIQVKVKVDPQERENKTPIKATMSGSVAKPGTGGAGKTSHLTRKKSDNDSDMSEDDDDDDDKDIQPGKKHRTAQTHSSVASPPPIGLQVAVTKVSEHGEETDSSFDMAYDDDL